MIVTPLIITHKPPRGKRNSKVPGGRHPVGPKPASTEMEGLSPDF